MVGHGVVYVQTDRVGSDVARRRTRRRTVGPLTSSQTCKSASVGSLCAHFSEVAMHYRLALVAVATLFACKTRHAGNESRARRVERVHRPGVADRREREADGRAGTRHLPRRYVG